MGMTDGETLFSLPPEYLYLGTAKWFGVLVSIWHSSMSCSRSSSATTGRDASWMFTGLVRSLPAKGQNMTFYVFAFAVIGGVSLNVGRGRMIGALTGGILLGLHSILVLSRIAAFWIDAAYVTIILVALVFSWATGGRPSRSDGD